MDLERRKLGLLCQARKGTNIVEVYGCLSTSYHEKVDFDLDLQYPHLTPCSAISTQSTEDWYSADKNLRTLWVNEVPRVELETLGSDHRCIEKMEEQYVRCLTLAELSP